jgi:hypothetical protein
MIHVPFDPRITPARVGDAVRARSRLADWFHGVRRAVRDLSGYRVAGWRQRNTTSPWGDAGPGRPLRAGQPLEQTPMVMTAVFGGRTYTRPPGRPRAGSW